jgi:hypothetical protein
MKITKFFTILLLFTVSGFVMADFPEEEGVLVLGEDNFNDALKV